MANEPHNIPKEHIELLDPWWCQNVKMPPRNEKGYLIISQKGTPATEKEWVLAQYRNMGSFTDEQLEMIWAKRQQALKDGVYGNKQGR